MQRVRTHGNEGCISVDEEVEPGEGDQVDRELAKVRVELSGEAEGGGDASHDTGNNTVEVLVRRRGNLERPNADVVAE